MASTYNQRLCALVLLALVGSSLARSRRKKNVTRADFPDGFVFGTASSAYQYEGAANQSGRGPSIWDTFSQTEGNVLGDANGNVAVDQYHRYEEDISLMANMGMDAYRFSISWSRLYPEGKDELNEVGIAYYNNLINGLLEKGIQPFVTLYHFDFPQALEDSYAGWLSSECVDDYANFANTCFQYFGDRVKFWITFNEPTIFILFGYNTGIMPPQRCSQWMGQCAKGNSSIEPYVVQHNVLLAHAAAVDIYRKNYQPHQKGKIGLALSGQWYIPYSDSYEDVKAASRIMDFTFGWHVSPLMYGKYPSIMRKLVSDRLPVLTYEEKRKLNNSMDFLGINYYTTEYAFHIDSHGDPRDSNFYQDSMTNTTGERNGVLIGPQAASSWLYIYPKGLYQLLRYIKRTYPAIPPIYILENGVDEGNNASLTQEEVLNDRIRIKYYKDHLYYLALAIRKGIDVRGFFAWSLLDNFEWLSGYSVRFGLNYVDYSTLARYPKKSARWFRKILKKYY